MYVYIYILHVHSDTPISAQMSFFCTELGVVRSPFESLHQNSIVFASKVGPDITPQFRNF